jgi:hypothetical protein
LPVILNRHLILWPSQMLDWFGERPLHDLSFVMLAGFCGVSLVASSDAYFYRVRLDEELAQLSGFVSTESCSFCLEPTKFGLPNLSYPGIMPAYSMAHTLEHPELPPVIVSRQDDVGRYVTREQMEVFMSYQLGARRKKDGLRLKPRTLSMGDASHRVRCSAAESRISPCALAQVAKQLPDGRAGAR